MPDPEIRALSYAHALREALDQAMESDPTVLVIGEGVPDPKAIFGTTSALRSKYGDRRVFDMPLSENGVTGICIGAAMSGLRPVMVHQRIDFAMLAMDQIVNNAAKWHYMFDGQASIPLVVRAIIGRGWGQGPQHSQSLHAMFAQVPGLKVVMPTTAHDAKGMLIAAIEDNNPVLFIEHRWLHNITGMVPASPYRVPLDRASILHPGNDVTIAAFSYMAVEALIAARELKSCSCAAEVIDMRSARPLDIDTVAESVRKTGRLLIADTGGGHGGVGAEIISEIVRREFTALKAPPIQISPPDHPVPTSHFIADLYYPDPLKIAEAALSLVQRQPDPANSLRMRDKLRRRGPLDVPDSSFSGPF